MKKKKLKSKNQPVRTRNWEENHEHSFTHDRARHRRAQPVRSETAEDLDPLPSVFEPNGEVFSHSKKWAFVLKDGAEILCIIDERLKEQNATLLVPGDRVLVEYEEGQAIVRGVAPRLTRLSRPAGDHARVGEQIFAANLDVLLIVAAAKNPIFRPGLVDRYLIAAEQGGVDAVLCLNKIDLVEEMPEDLQLYRDLGMPVFPISCKTGAGIDPLLAHIRGKLCVLSGHSGVGKSTLLNRLDPDLDLDTQEVSQSTQRGRHTTTASRLYQLGGGTRIIDTPGIRALGLWRVDPEEVAFYFPELAAAAANCHFRNCTHTHEPDCGVKAGLDDGTVLPQRYASYLRIRASLESDENITPGRMFAL
ncbi:MAG: ribosome small subunit-dependent GTPase A [Candidatus Hydrogenedentes bacterium]|nr:ribosome small subunit-dependent GTPase A [Candidatus Hydrogenedentota bacterium]